MYDVLVNFEWSIPIHHVSPFLSGIKFNHVSPCMIDIIKTVKRNHIMCLNKPKNVRLPWCCEMHSFASQLDMYCIHTTNLSPWIVHLLSWFLAMCGQCDDHIRCGWYYWKCSRMSFETLQPTHVTPLRFTVHVPMPHRWTLSLANSSPPFYMLMLQLVTTST